MRTIMIERKRGYYGMGRALTIKVDGEKRGELRQGETIEVALPDGARGVTARMDWGETKPFDLSGVGDGDRLIVKPGGANPLNWFGLGDVPFRFSVATA